MFVVLDDLVVIVCLLVSLSIRRSIGNTSLTFPKFHCPCLHSFSSVLAHCQLTREEDEEKKKKKKKRKRKKKKTRKKQKKTGKKLREKRKNGRRTGGGTDCEREPATQEGIFFLFD